MTAPPTQLLCLWIPPHPTPTPPPPISHLLRTTAFRHLHPAPPPPYTHPFDHLLLLMPLFAPSSRACCPTLLPQPMRLSCTRHATSTSSPACHTHLSPA